MPVATKPWTPASISFSMFSFSAGTSIWSSAVKGVVTAGMMPSKRPLGELHVSADAVDVLDGVEGRRPRRRRRRSPRRSCGARPRGCGCDRAPRSSRRAGAATAAGPSATRRDRRSASRTGLAVIAASWRWNRRSDAFQVARSTGSASIAASSFSAVSSRWARAAARRATAGSSASRASSTADGRRVVQCAVRRRRADDEGAGAVARLDDALERQRGECLAHRRAADLQRARQVTLGRQALTRTSAPERMSSARRSAICS